MFVPVQKWKPAAGGQKHDHVSLNIFFLKSVGEKIAQTETEIKIQKHKKALPPTMQFDIIIPVVFVKVLSAKDCNEAFCYKCFSSIPGTCNFSTIIMPHLTKLVIAEHV